MCFIRLQHFTGVLLFFYILHSIPPCSVITTEYIPLNTSEEIKSIFSDVDVNNRTSEHLLQGKSNSGNFAEGGLVNVNSMSTRLTSTTQKIFNVTTNFNLTTHKNVTEQENGVQNKINVTDKDNSDSLALKNQMLTKLNETGSNLFLGVPEVVHINGTSSIKPRKGVYYNKIVPRKGVENEIDESHNHACFWVTEEECYNIENMHNVECSCCEEGNLLGTKVKEQPIVSCKNCNPVNLAQQEEKQICRNVCCKKKLLDDKTYSVSTTEDILDIPLYHTNNQENVSSINSTKPIHDISDSKKLLNEQKSHKNSSKILKHKPSITKVPYDVEVVTELLSKAKQKVFVPVLVSIFLLPLVGILIFFFWRRTKEFWDKRYYKKVDFLIDGMYND